MDKVALKLTLIFDPSEIETWGKTTDFEVDFSTFLRNLKLEGKRIDTGDEREYFLEICKMEETIHDSPLNQFFKAKKNKNNEADWEAV